MSGTLTDITHDTRPFPPAMRMWEQVGILSDIRDTSQQV